MIQKQKQSLEVILNPEVEVPWKILIYDHHCEKILSTLYRVGDLREMCLTLHLGIMQKRDKLHGVTAIYLIEPTQVNMDLLIEDFSRDLYSRVIINFCSKVTNQLDYLAKEISRIPRAAFKILKIYEHAIDYVSLNDNLFTLSNDFVESLFAFVMTMKVAPVFVYQVKHEKKSAIEKVVAAVIDRLQGIDLSEQPSLTIILADRDDDWNPLIVHSDTYIGLLHDLHKIDHNKATIETTFDLNPQYDRIWAEFATLPMKQATDAIDREFNDWNLQYKTITEDQLKISTAMDLVPQMNQNKRVVEQHINIARSIIECVTQRQLVSFQKFGQSIINNEKLQDIEMILTGKESDKVRLLLLMLLNNSFDEFNKYFDMFNIKEDHHLKAINHIKEKVAFGQYKIMTSQNKLKNMFTGLTNTVLKNVLSREKKYAIINLIESVFNGDLMDYFKVYDTRTQTDKLSLVQDLAVVFLEGGSYNEYAELCEYARDKKRNILYGASKMFTAEEVIRQFSL